MKDFLAKHFTQLEPVALNAGKIVTALLIFFIGWLISIWAKRILRKALSRTENTAIDATIKPLLVKLVQTIILILALLIALSKAGIPTTSLIAILAAGGLAIGLALQGTLSNIAAGFMLLSLRPLKVDEFIETPNISGNVVEVGIFTTILKTMDGLYLSAPNAQIWGNRIQNYDRFPTRRVNIKIGVAYNTNLDRASEIILAAMNNHHNVLLEPKIPEVFVDDFADSAVTMLARCWIPTDEWRVSSSELRISIKNALDQAGIEIPFPQRVIHQK